jgi:uncharacterized membrane protein HdeD (DUF308 family)
MSQPQTTERPEKWWVLLVQGVVAIVIGILVVTIASVSSAVLLQIIGWYWLVIGILRIASGASAERRSTWNIVVGAIGVLAGLAAITFPLWQGIIAPSVLVVILGIYGILEGLWTIGRAIRKKQWPLGLLGALSLLFGVLLVLAPVSPAILFAQIIGVLAIIGGLIAAIAAWMRRPKGTTT